MSKTSCHQVVVSFWRCRRVRGQVPWFNNIKALCHGKLERYQRPTFIMPYFVAWTNSRCLRTMRTTYVSSTSFVGKRSLMLTHRVRPFSPDVMSMPIVWWATMYISFSRKDLLTSHRRSILHSSKGDKRCRPLWQHGMWVSSLWRGIWDLHWWFGIWEAPRILAFLAGQWNLSLCAPWPVSL